MESWHVLYMQDAVSNTAYVLYNSLNKHTRYIE